MFYCYAVLSFQGLQGVVYKEFYGFRSTKLDMMNFFISEIHAPIMNLIELTEEEYRGILENEVNRDHDKWKRLNA